MTGAVDGFMEDSDAGNIAMVGHRRWQLNPKMGKVGFGTAGRFVAEAALVAITILSRGQQAGISRQKRSNIRSLAADMRGV